MPLPRPTHAHDGATRVPVTVVAPEGEARRVVLFAVGGGGDPLRHQPLLEALGAHGCFVVAPHFERLMAPSPTDDEVSARPRRLRRALEQLAPAALPVAVVGHSLGGMAGLCLAGATPWRAAGHPVAVEAEPRVDRLVLLAPAAAFFRAPGALEPVQARTLVYAGTRDEVTPPAMVRGLTQLAHVELREVPDAGHFSFMHTPPPHAQEAPGFDRAAFLATLVAEVLTFVTSD